MVTTKKKNAGTSRAKRTLKGRSAAAVHPDHHIPRGYNIDTIVIMPVSNDTSFIYWEVTDRLFNGKGKKLKSGSAKLMIRVYETDRLREVSSFEVKEIIGKSYINYQPSFTPLTAEIGIVNSRGFTGLLRSGTVSPSPRHHSSLEKIPPLNIPASAKKSPVRSQQPSVDPSVTEYEVWMTKTEERCGAVCVPFSKGSSKGTEITKYYNKASAIHKNPSSIRIKKAMK